MHASLTPEWRASHRLLVEACSCTLDDEYYTQGVMFSPRLKAMYELWRFPENILLHGGIASGAPLSLLVSEDQAHLWKDLQLSRA